MSQPFILLNLNRAAKRAFAFTGNRSGSHLLLAAMLFLVVSCDMGRRYEQKDNAYAPDSIAAHEPDSARPLSITHKLEHTKKRK